ncbi:MAG: hypothetical protein M3S32_04460 [Acidobacteriota bacterium]|nr:hypothetical protein [Acidobacteriota bacterium]
MAVRMEFGLVCFYASQRVPLFSIPSARFEQHILNAIENGEVFADVSVPRPGHVRSVLLKDRRGNLLVQKDVRVSALDLDETRQPRGY